MSTKKDRIIGMFVAQRYNHIGLVFIEFLIAMTLAILMMGLLFHWYIGAQSVNQLQIALHQLSEQGRLSASILRQAVKKAGQTSCGRFLVPFVFTQKELTVNQVSDNSVLLKEGMLNQTQLIVSNEIRFAKGDRSVISDCKKAEVFIIKDIFQSGKLQTISTMHPLQYEFKPYAEINRLEVNTYKIMRTKRKNKMGQFIYALYVRDIKGRHTELVEGVERLSVYLDNTLPSGVQFELDMAIYPLKKHWYVYVAL